jgi:predicted phosphodiesterase
MKRLAIISDIHGNLTALEAVLRRIDTMNVDGIVCLGDIVGYGGDPGACLDLVRSRCRLTVRGNHDEAALDTSQCFDFNSAARAAIFWTRSALTMAQKAWLKSLPTRAHVGLGVVAHHDSPLPREVSYLHDAAAAARAYAGAESPITLIGHTHVPAAFETGSLCPEDRLKPEDVAATALRDGDTVMLDPGCRYILNPGSVGQPRDADCRAAFAVLDLVQCAFTVHREMYDIAAAQLATRRAGLPMVLAERLALGA